MGQALKAQTVSIFISHRATDVKLAEALIHCLETCLELTDGSIRCTSVPGYELDVGDDFSRVLRENLRACKVVIGLITEQSLASAYVLMELGAAWALEKRICPVLPCNVPFSSICGPIAGTHAIHTDMSGIANLVDVIAQCGNFTKRKTSLVTTSVDTFVKSANAVTAKGAEGNVDVWNRLFSFYADQVTYALRVNGPMRSRYDGTLEASGEQQFYKLRVRGYNVPNADYLRIDYMGDDEGVPPWGFGHLARPGENTPMFTLRRSGTGVETIPGNWPGGPERPWFE